MMKKLLLTIVVLGALGAGAGAFYRYRTPPTGPTVTTATVTRGDIADTIGATGTLQAVTTVQVGTQVSGIIEVLNADFNSLVRKGQVIARLDPSLFQTQIEQARANLIRAEADLERLRVTLDDARTKLRRAQDLSARQLIPQSELESADVAVRSTEAQIRSSEAQVTQAEASLNQTEVNLAHTVIEAPIDGLVISRNVDVGQTVAASMSAPTLFVLAADLTKMQVVANLDESDVGRIRPGQRVTFRVDAYPAEDFGGTVSQVRLQPIVQQNVVTYATVIDVPNPQLKLKPGMTANVTVEVSRRDNAIRVPNAALRFRPSNDMFAALGQTPPSAAGGGGRGRGAGPEGRTAQAAPPAMPAPGAGQQESPAPSAAAEPGAGGRGGGRGGRGRGDFAARLEGLSPEEREQMIARMRGRGLDPGAFGAADGTPPQRAAQAGSGDASMQRNPEATTIDALFGPLPAVESVGNVWVHVDNELRPVRVRVGITDGQATELLDGDITPDMELVTNVTTGNEPARNTPAAGASPLFQQQQRGGGGRGRGF
jgi:HlyD family secretion protein